MIFLVDSPVTTSPDSEFDLLRQEWIKQHFSCLFGTYRGLNHLEMFEPLLFARFDSTRLGALLWDSIHRSRRLAYFPARRFILPFLVFSLIALSLQSAKPYIW